MDRQALRIGQVAKRSGVSADTIRYYERISLMPKASRSPNGYREYGDSAIDRVRLVQNALRFGFSLKQLRSFLHARQVGGAPCKDVRLAGAEILSAVERRIAELNASRNAIRQTLKQWDQRLTRTREGQAARLLEMLPAGLGRPTARRLSPR
jgi:DNA-binding transcriptional MerR regulator